MIAHVFQELKSDFNRLQKKRKIAAIYQKLMWGLAGLFFIFMLVYLVCPMGAQSYTPSFSVAAIAFMVVLHGVVFLFLKLHNTFKEEEQNIITKMTSRLFPDFKFHPAHYLTEQELAKSQIFQKITTRPSTYGLLMGKVGELPFHMADIGISEYSNSKKVQNFLLRIPYVSLLVVLYEHVLKNIFTSKTADTVHHSFRGLFCWTNFNKDIKGLTVVLPDTLEARYGSLAKTVQLFTDGRGQLVNLEDTRFENEFVVYSTDQVEARYILSAFMMEKLYELKQRFNHPIMLSFYQNKIYLAVHLEHGLFAFNPNDLTSQKAIENIYAKINLAKQMVLDLNLHVTLTPSAYEAN